MEDSNPQQLIKALRKAIQENALARARHEDGPERFVESEMELAGAIRAVTSLASDVTGYPLLVELGLLGELLSLLAHDNTDVSAMALDVLAELLDPENYLEDQQSAGALFNEFLTVQSGPRYLVDFLERLLVPEELDSTIAAQRTLELLEGLLDTRPTLSVLLATESTIFSHLLKILTLAPAKEASSDALESLDELRLSASELLAILLHESGPDLRTRLVVGDMQSVGVLPTLLKCLSGVPARGLGATATETAKNQCHCVGLLLLEESSRIPAGSTGVIESLCRLLSERTVCFPEALNAMSLALQGTAENCRRFVHAGGLKVLFSLLAGKLTARKGVKGMELEDPQEHAVAWILQLFLHLSGVDYRRLVKKFMELEGQKVGCLVRLHQLYQGSVEKRKTEEEEEEEPEDEEEVNPRTLVLQSVDLILMFLLTAGNPELQVDVRKRMTAAGLTTGDLRANAQSYRDALGDESGRFVCSVVDGLVGLLEE